ncbi:BON domain-containing protein [Anatilimnocola floriformis]|uniref:BON domain-containing protein n=1 Tax=Anatilimnocola floriformis TaxID=2948575 RepID=UPI0020C2977E|nr:BON domain-containing protein [Anatilimnocola floriformis]
MLTNALGRQPAATEDDLTLARAALSRSSIYVLRRLQLDRDGESIVMRGRVDSYYHKQLAQELVKAAAEGIEVVNALQVVYTPKLDYVVESR